ncbi:hypothetical protein [Nocardia sp. NPDC004722]
MRNEFAARCRKCGEDLGPGQGIVHTRGQHRPFPVLCDPCMTEVDEIDRENEKFDRDHDE